MCIEEINTDQQSAPNENRLFLAPSSTAPMHGDGVKPSATDNCTASPTALHEEKQDVVPTVQPDDNREHAVGNALPPAEEKSRARKKKTAQSHGNFVADVQSPSDAISIARNDASLHIVMITPELAPVAKVGGLGDVVFGLSRELERRGQAVEIILPKYNCMRFDQIGGLRSIFDDLWVPWFGGAIHCSVVKGWVHGRVCFFIDAHSNDNFFNRGCIYGCSDDVMRFAFFCKAALEFLLKSNRRPDVLHCHDWPTGITPVLLYEMYAAAGMGDTRVCFTIHNFKHQGSVGQLVLAATGLNRPEYYFRNDKIRDNYNPRALNLLKAGIVYSNFVTTVSPHYAWDSRFGGQGFGLEPTLNEHHRKFGGIVNGVDYEYWDPAADPYLPYHYSADAIEKKYDNKRLLRQRFWLADNEKPLVAFVGRLDPQKGLDLVRHAIYYCLGHRAQFVLLGSSPDSRINGAFWDLKHRLNENPDCHLEIAYNEELSHLVYAGSDLMLVPSLYEPCGLAQLIALRYGSVPVVRAAGGLIDTVIDKDYSKRPVAERNGFVFNDADTHAVEWALERAIACYYQYPKDFKILMLNGMRQDWSWREPAGHYLNIYEWIRAKKPSIAPGELEERRGGEEGTRSGG